MPFLYPYDPLGTYPSNLITNELHTVTAPTSDEEANFIVPNAAPFFMDGIIFRTGPAPTDPVLIENVDYYLTHQFVEATQSLNKRIYGSITFVNRMFSGSVYLTYQTLGGPYTLDDYSVVTELTKSLYAIRVVTWGQIVGVPVAFPPVEHPHHTSDLTGMTEIVQQLQSLVGAVTANGGNINTLVSTLTAHITGMAAHTKAQVGLDNLPNYRAATQSDIDSAVPNALVTPQMLSYGIARFVTGSGSVGLKLDLLASSVQRVYNGSSEQYEDSLLLNNAFVTVDCNNYIKEGKYWVADMTNIANAPFSWCVMEVTNISVDSTNPAVGEVLQIFDDGLGRRARRIRQQVSAGVYQWSAPVITTNDTVLPPPPPSGTGPFVPITGSSIDLDDYTTTGNFSFSTAVFPINAPPAPGPAATFHLQVLVTPTWRYTVQIAINTTSNKTYVRGGYENEYNSIDFWGHHWRQVPTIDSIVNDTSVNNILTDGSYLCRIENNSTVFSGQIPLISCRAFLLYVKNALSTQTIVQVVYNLIDSYEEADEVYKIFVRADDFNQGPLNNNNAEFNNSGGDADSPIEYFLSITDMNRLQNYLGPDGLVVSETGIFGLRYSLYSAYNNNYGIGLGRILVDTDLNLAKNEGFYIFRSEDNVINTPPALNSSERFYVMLTIGTTTTTAQVIFQPYGRHSTSSVYVRHQTTNDWNNGVTPPNWTLLPN